MKCRYTPRPANLTRFPFSAYAGYSSRLWYALHPLIRYSLHYRMCFHRPHTYSKICRYTAPMRTPKALFFVLLNKKAPFRVCKHPFRVGSVCLPRPLAVSHNANALKNPCAVRLRSTGDKPSFSALQSLTKSLCALFPCRARFSIESLRCSRTHSPLRLPLALPVVKEHRRSFRFTRPGSRTTCDTHGK